MFRVYIRLSSHNLSGLTDHKTSLRLRTFYSSKKSKTRAFRNGVHVLQGSLGRLEGEEGSQAHHAVELADALHALLHLPRHHRAHEAL